MFLLVLAQLDSPGQGAVKQLHVCVCVVAHVGDITAYCTKHFFVILVKIVQKCSCSFGIFDVLIYSHMISSNFPNILLKSVASCFEWLHQHGILEFVLFLAHAVYIK